jgi:hypothetical protein
VVGEAIDFRDNSVLPDSVIATFRDSMVARGFVGGYVSVGNGI